MREIVLDTETTGLEPDEGHRLVEIGALELVRHIPTGRVFHVYLNPERPMPPDAYAVHGLSDDFLRTQPLFATIAQAFEEFIGDAPLVMHNAGFDFRFLNAELARLKRSLLLPERVLDTLALARQRHPMGPNNLDALCRRYGVDNSQRTRHGALLDAELLAEVYLELIGGRQTALVFAERPSIIAAHTVQRLPVRPRPSPLPDRVTADELAAHAAFVATLGRAPLWDRWLAADPAKRLASG
jgi:DNA polymerase III subunit epsilon